MIGERSARTAGSIASLGWMALIFWLSSLSATGLPGRLAPLAHFGFYAVLAVAYGIALGGRTPSRRALAIAVLLASVYGITDEIHQAFVPGRTPDAADWLVDTLGAVAGAVALGWAAWTLRRGPREDQPGDDAPDAGE